MIIDGKQIASDIQEAIREKIHILKKPLTLRVFILQSNPTTEQFIRIKQRVGEKLGIEVNLENLPKTSSTDDVISAVRESAQSNDGIIIQLPLPSTINLKDVLSVLPREKDVDVLGDDAQKLFIQGESLVLPPVVSAMKEIVHRHHYSVKNKKVVIVGNGRLVGAPARIWFEHEGGEVVVVTEESGPLEMYTQTADIIVLGAGKARLLKPSMIREGVVILDAGTSVLPEELTNSGPRPSEAGGKVVGDADPLCSEKASIFTPVPGGIGPIAVSLIFQNLYLLNSSNT